MEPRRLRILLEILAVCAVVAIILCREQYLYPGAFECVVESGCSFGEPPVEDAERYITTEDGATLRVWQTRRGSTNSQSDTVIIFGGDSGRIEHLNIIASWFKAHQFWMANRRGYL